MERCNRLWISVLGLFLIIFSPWVLAEPVLLNAIHVMALPNQTQLVLDFNHATEYKIIHLPNPPRIAIDLPNVKLNTQLNNINTLNTPISHIRAGHPVPKTLRIVCDLTKVLATKDSFDKQQLIIELSDNTKTNTAPQPVQQPVQQITQQPPQQTMTTLPLIGNKPIVVVIDPGHGGKDPGTSGSLGVKEKDVVLAIAINLQKILSKQPGYKAVLTRKRDYFIPLRGRLAITRKNSGNMFIAIHADAYRDPYATGASVFALSAHGASSEAARWLAEKENYSELGGVDLRDKSDMLRSVLIDLSQTATISSSLQLGSDLIQQLGQVGNLHYRTVEQAPFMVLKSPDIPSVLVETGFLSNPQEQARLRNPMAQMQIANALAKGIMNYFQKNPPPGTLVATLQNQNNERP